MAITKQTRLESYIQRPVSRQSKILEILGESELTARQIMLKCGYSDMNAVRPRITELKLAGLIEECGKAFDIATKRNVAVFRATKGTSLPTEVE